MKMFKLKHIIYILLAALFVSLLFAIDFTFFSKTSADGYDLSSHNRNLNWEKLSKSQFVYLKATEGSDFTDKKYRSYKQKARENNLKVGAYHFMCNDCTGKKQFNHFRNVVGKDIDLIPVLDVEISGISNNNILEFVSECEKYYGVKPLIYINYYNRIKYYSAIKNCKIWLSNKTPFKPLCDYVIEQYAIEEIDGVEIDHNRINPKYTIKDFTL